MNSTQSFSYGNLWDSFRITLTKNVPLQQPIYLSNSKKILIVETFWKTFQQTLSLMAWHKSNHISVTKTKVHTPMKNSTYSTCFVFLELYCNVDSPLAHFSFRHISHVLPVIWLKSCSISTMCVFDVHSGVLRSLDKIIIQLINQTVCVNKELNR